MKKNFFIFFTSCFLFLAFFYTINFSINVIKNRDITSFNEFLCKIESKVKFSIGKKWLQQSCYDFFLLPYPNLNKKNINQKETLVKSNLDLSKVESFDYNISNKKWIRSHGNNFSNKISSIDVLNKKNLSDLNLAWKFDLGNRMINIETNPIFVDNKLILPDVNNNFIAINPVDGKKIWSINLPAPVSRRGLSSDVEEENIFVPTGDGVYAINIKNGLINENLGKKGKFSNILSLVSPIVTNDKVFISDRNSNIQAFNKSDGKLLWSQSTKKTNNFKGARNWGGMSYDHKRDLLFISTGNPRGSYDYLGLTRPGKNLYSNSLLAIKGESGKIKWFFTDTEHDLWDLDISFPPILSTLILSNKKIDIVTVIAKSGNILTFEREYGFRLFDYELKKTKDSKIFGEETNNFQKVVINPENILNHEILREHLSDSTPEISENVFKQFQQGDSSFFLPPEIHKEIFFNGVAGGAQWMGGAINQEGILFAHVNVEPWAISIQTKIHDQKKLFEGLKDMKVSYINNCASCHGINADKSKIGIFNKDFVNMNSLLGISFTKFTTEEKYIDDVKKKHPTMDEKLIKNSVKYLIANDQFQIENMNIYLEPNVRIFKDQFGNFATKPPWGYLIAVDLQNQKIKWKVPSGEMSYNLSENKTIQKEGSPNWGGILITENGLIISTGEYDNNLKFYSQTNGELLHKINLPGMGSAPPITYQIGGKQFISVIITGGGQNISQKEKILYTFSLENK
jgi:quinoprotein glucose dehydrogenase